MLQGPFPLSEIDSKIEDKTIGAYLLSRGNHVAHYVGRSDTDIKKRVKQHLNESNGYVEFWYEAAKSSLEAYNLECKWYHKYNPTKNDCHPALPTGSTWKCPVAGCQWST